MGGKSPAAQEQLELTGNPFASFAQQMADKAPGSFGPLNADQLAERRQMKAAWEAAGRPAGGYASMTPEQQAWTPQAAAAPAPAAAAPTLDLGAKTPGTEGFADPALAATSPFGTGSQTNTGDLLGEALQGTKPVTGRGAGKLTTTV